MLILIFGKNNIFVIKNIKNNIFNNSFIKHKYFNRSYTSDFSGPFIYYIFPKSRYIVFVTFAYK